MDFDREQFSDNDDSPMVSVGASPVSFLSLSIFAKLPTNIT